MSITLVLVHIFLIFVIKLRRHRLNWQIKKAKDRAFSKVHTK